MSHLISLVLPEANTIILDTYKMIVVVVMETIVMVMVMDNHARLPICLKKCNVLAIK